MPDMPDMPSMLPPLGWNALLHTWTWQPGWDLGVLAVLAAYGGLVLGAHRRGVRAVHPARMLAFAAGLLVLAVTLGSAIDVYAMTLFWDHMIEHLLLIMVVPALLVLGHPITVLRATLGPAAQARADRVLQSRALGVLTHPLVAVGLYTAVIVGTHLTSFMDDMAARPWLGTAEQLLYVAAGYLLLLPLIGSEPIRWRLPQLFRVVLLLFAMVPDTVVGIVLMQSQANLFPMMHAGAPSWAPSPADDQQIGGALMWVGGDGLMMVLAIGIAVAFIAEHGRSPMLGTWVEGVRRSTLSDRLEQAHLSSADVEDQADLDTDEAALDAYNRLLRRLNEPQSATGTPSADG